MSTMGIGEFLRIEREKRRITLEQVASTTKISVKLLQALEAEHFEELPARPFIRGFVVSYAKFIGLDSNDVLTRFGPMIDQKASEVGAKHSEPGESFAFDRRDGERSKTILWIVMGSLIVVGGLVLVVLKPALKHRRSSQVETLKAAYGTPTPAPSLSLSLSPLPSPSPTLSLSSIPSPSPTFSLSPSPIPSVKLEKVLVPIPSPSPTPTLSPSPSPSAVPTLSAPAVTSLKESVDPNYKPKETDSLQKGDNLKPEEIRVKAVFRMAEDNWVRYKIDDRTQMRIPVRKGREIVLRANRSIHAQFSKPETVEVRLSGREFLPAVGHRIEKKVGGQIFYILTKDFDGLANNPLAGLPALPADVPPARGETSAPTDSTP